MIYLLGGRTDRHAVDRHCVDFPKGLKQKIFSFVRLSSLVLIPVLNKVSPFPIRMPLLNILWSSLRMMSISWNFAFVFSIAIYILRYKAGLMNLDFACL